MNKDYYLIDNDITINVALYYGSVYGGSNCIRRDMVLDFCNKVNENIKILNPDAKKSLIFNPLRFEYNDIKNDNFYRICVLDNETVFVLNKNADMDKMKDTYIYNGSLNHKVYESNNALYELYLEKDKDLFIREFNYKRIMMIY